MPTIDLSGLNLGDDHARRIAQVLERAEYVQSVNISHNRIGDDGAVAMASLLQTNRVLVSIDMSSNRITYIGAHAIKEALKANKASHLCSLSLEGNAIDDRKSLFQSLTVLEKINRELQRNRARMPNAQGPPSTGSPQTQPSVSKTTDRRFKANISSCWDALTPLSPKFCLQLLSQYHIKSWNLDFAVMLS